MIKFKGSQPNGRKLLGIGLEKVNTDALREGKPITVELDDYGAPGVDLFICWGETQEDLFKMLKHLVTSETVVRDERPREAPRLVPDD